MNLNLKNRLIAAVLALPSGFFVFLFIYRLLSGGAYEILFKDGVFYGLLLQFLLIVAFLVPSVLEVILLYKLSANKVASLKSLEVSSFYKKVIVVVRTLGYSLLLAVLYQSVAFAIIYFAGVAQYMILDGLTLVYVTMSFFFAKVGDYLKYLVLEKRMQ